VGNGGTPGMITDDSEIFWLDNLESEIDEGAFVNSSDLMSTFTYIRSTFLTFMGPCIVIYFYSKTN
jgi:hypothetical protein